MRTTSLLASGVVLLSVVAALHACSSEEPGAVTPPVAIDASTEDVTTDSGVDSGLVVGCPGETPASYPWSPAVPKEVACTDADLAKLALEIKGKQGATVTEIRAALGPTCSACAIGKVGDAQWRAIVDGHDGYIGNVGGCVVQLGATDACGRSTDRLSTCLILGCAGCAVGSDQDVCADALTAVDGSCAEHLKAVRKDCRSGAIDNAFSPTGPCQSFVETIRLFCGPAMIADAGTD